MVNMMLWTALSFSAAVAHGAIIPRQGSGDINLAALIRNAPQVQRHQKSIQGALNKGLPYSEGLLEASKSLVKLDGLKEEERKCLYLRNTVKQDGFQSYMDINPHSDAPDVVTGDKEKKIEITTSTAVVDVERLGWNKEVATEIGGSATIEASAGIGVFSASLSATVYGNQRTSEGQNGEASKQTEFRQDVRREEVCPPNSICRIVTWTYTRTIKGKCFLNPYYDEQCATGNKRKGKYSLGLFPTCQPLQGVATQFFDFDYDNYKSASGFGPENQGLKMHKPEIVKANKYDEDCTFTYALRDENGTPVKATANIIETEPDSSVKKSAVTKTPKAVGWFEDEDGVRSCELEDGWFMQANSAYYIPTEAGGQGVWEYRDDLPEPQGLKDKCPQYSSLTKRAVAGSKKGPPPNPLFKVVIIDDGVPEFLKKLTKTNSDGYAANLILNRRLEVEEPGYIVIEGPGEPEPEPSAQQCLAELNK
ncbi:uncharacterized protein BBA_10262 [Beauveria bassiana ARSEF 2860]|uniref:Uncharacterized protein n=1 Tax=Beauveria bassiana (strain ARSEF 2860) TaxID=655819 RepID=J4KKP1_BEAB2|nr:uncharacterized protein BBA_10262 [Beauveria bassiana ARSEF 2860]EJP60794.1 hypothetical protein BBA_10262 [Beauveria bassiana ARSEF 2860]